MVSNTAYHLEINDNTLLTAYSSNRFYGSSLRCLSSLPRPSDRGESIVKQKNNNHFHYVNHYTNSVTSQNIIKDLNLVLIRILMSNSNYYDKNYP